MGQEVVITDTKKTHTADQRFVSILERQIDELVEIRYPGLSRDDQAQQASELVREVNPVYVYFPWKNTQLEMVPESLFIEIKTNRNKLLINAEEQEKLLGVNVSIAGMSVGSSLLYGLVGTGVARKIVIADDDEFSTSNLNRVQATVLDIGESKVVVAARRALEMNPFLSLTVINRRLDESNISGFFPGEGKSIIFEEIDDFRMKLIIREQAKEKGVPVVMLTNLGDNVLVDVERYDLDPGTHVFNGGVSSDLLDQVRHKEIDQAMMKQLAVALVDKSLVPDRALTSLQEIGKTLVGRPQLYGTVALDGGIAPFLVRTLLLDDDLPSGRYALKLSSIFRTRG